MTEQSFEVSRDKQVVIKRLTHEGVEAYADRLLELVRHIPEVQYEVEDLLASEKPDGRQLTNKWQHSYILIEDDEIAGMIMGYERAAEGSEQYPEDSLYLSELAVDPAKRGHGYAKQLIRQFLSDALVQGVQRFTLQTNSAEWNQPVRSLYESFGFRVSGTKAYDNRTDVIMSATADKLIVGPTHGDKDAQ